MPKRKSKKKEKDWRKFWKLGNKNWNTDFYDVSKGGDLVFTKDNIKHNLHKIISKYGTPLRIVFPSVIKDRLKDLEGYFQAYIKIHEYKGKFSYHFPMKVNQSREFIISLLGAGANLETTSANELWLVKKLWDRKKLDRKIKVLCNGPKTDDYMDLIEELHRKKMNVVPIIDGIEEIDRILKHKGDIGVRVDLDFKAETNWSKKFHRFGLPEHEVLNLPKAKNLKILHYHLGCQIKSQNSILEGIRRAFSIYVKLQKKQPTLDTLDIGGGFNLPYEKKDLYTAKPVVANIVKLLKNLSKKYGVKEPNLIVEWGQYIVAPAAITLYKATSEKPVSKASASAWYVIDGSFINDLKDTWGVYQKWHILPANNMKDPLKRVWLAGSTCDSDDKYTAGGHYLKLPKLDKGDQYIAVLDTGAYQDSFLTHHCWLSAPMKIVLDEKIKVIRKRTKPEQISKLFGWNNGDYK